MREMPMPQALSEIALQYVYVISAPQLGLKIGRARNPADRLRALQCACPKQLTLERKFGHYPVLLASAIERTVHGVFKAHRIKGEWFSAPTRAVVYAEIKKARHRFMPVNRAQTA
jgi:hypothetical protein